MLIVSDMCKSPRTHRSRGRGSRRRIEQISRSRVRRNWTTFEGDASSQPGRASATARRRWPGRGRGREHERIHVLTRGVRLEVIGRVLNLAPRVRGRNISLRLMSALIWSAMAASVAGAKMLRVREVRTPLDPEPADHHARLEEPRCLILRVSHRLDLVAALGERVTSGGDVEVAVIGSEEGYGRG